MNAFQATELDIAGSLFIRYSCNNCNKTSKVYILLLTCASSRVIHFELIWVYSHSHLFLREKDYEIILVQDNAITFRAVEAKKFILSIYHLGGVIFTNVS